MSRTHTYRVLWAKAIGEARLLLVSLTVLMFGFHWLFVWLSSLVELGALGMFLGALPSEFERLAGVSFQTVATNTGRIALAYVDPVVMLAATTWSIARGSDAVSGEIGRGTMEMLLAQPVRRLSVLAIQAAVTTGGAAILALAAWLGTSAGLATVALSPAVEASHFIPGAVNLFGLMFCLAGVATLASSWDNSRWRTIGLVGAFYVIELTLKMIARVAPDFGWLMRLSFLGAFEPQALIVDPANAWMTSLHYDSVLIGLGLAAYALAALIFCRRDLPAPLS
jgi:ABC-2 type transport system permease protein